MHIIFVVFDPDEFLNRLFFTAFDLFWQKYILGIVLDSCSNVVFHMKTSRTILWNLRTTAKYSYVDFGSQIFN